MQECTLQGQFVDGDGSRAHSVIDSAWRHCHVVGCHNLPSMSLLGVWDMAK